MCNFAPKHKRPMNKQDWTYKKLGEVATIYDSQRKPVTKKDRVNGIYPYYGATGIQDYVDSYLFDGRYLLLGEDGAKWGANDKSAFIIEGKSWVNNHAHIMRFDDRIIDSFVEYYLNGKDLTEYITGAVVPKLTQAKLTQIPIPVPPIADQERIVAELDLLSGIMEKKKEQLKAYDQLAQSIFYTMFGDPITNEKGWQVKKLGEICENCDSMRKPITAKDREQGEIPYYGASGIVDYVKDYIFDGDYLLISEDGANLIARSTPIAFSIKGKTWVNNHAHVLKFTNQITQQYVEFSINLRDVSAIVTGCAQPKLTQANLNRILISFPPLSLQQEFAEKVEAIERQKALVQQSIDETQTMFDCTMDKYFG